MRIKDPYYKTIDGFLLVDKNEKFLTHQNNWRTDLRKAKIFTSTSEVRRAKQESKRRSLTIKALITRWKIDNLGMTMSEQILTNLDQ